MGIKTYKPKTSSLRYKTTLSFDELSKGNSPLKSLTRGKVSRAGRDSSGRISVRRRGGGHKRRYREIDFGRRDKFGIPARVVSIEYDPNRSSNIALLVYRDGDKRYIVAPKGIKIGDVLESGPNAPIRIGNALPLEDIPVGKAVHNIELNVGKGGQLVRGAGGYAMVLASKVLITEELTPSDTMQVDLSYVKGFVTTVGGETSHAAILARTMGLPALVMTPLDIAKIKEGEQLIIDGLSSIIIGDPSSSELDKYEHKILEYNEYERELFALKNQDAKTKDGIKISLKANIGTSTDIFYVNKYGLDGIGLFRTEFLYMESVKPPTEDEQFEAYKRVVDTIEKKGVVTIRTLDIGGDKEIPYFKFPKEDNPFLGYRALRMYMDYEDLIQSQFNAIFRASHIGILNPNPISMFMKFDLLDDMCIFPPMPVPIDNFSINGIVNIRSKVESTNTLKSYFFDLSLPSERLIPLVPP
uniref:50S ribosomal protein L2 n=2 Tax=Borrelia puertoricensis TaxID=2756107 RepID=A0AA51YN40_9SPIR|nr:hypothetical protein MHINFGKF_00027 [Borrelia puertoricensis]